MITVILPNGNPTSYEGASHKEDVEAITREEADVDVSFNLCDFQCPYIEPAFSEVGAIVDEHKNDITPMLFILSLVTDTVTLKLIKCENGADVVKATIIEDNLIIDDTLGTFLPQSSFASNLKIGFIADWNLIFNAFGTGKYRFTADKVLIGQPIATTSWTYNLQVFTERDAKYELIFSFK